MRNYVTGCWFQKSLFALAVIGLLSCGNARANINLQDGTPLTGVAVGNGNAILASPTISLTNTVTAGASVLVVLVYDRDESLANAGSGTEASTLTWNPTGTPQTINRVIAQSNDTSHWADSDIFVLNNPTPGTAVISFTDNLPDGPSGLAMQAFTLNGVNTSIAPATNGVGNPNIDATGVLNMYVTNAPGAWAVVCTSGGDGGTGLSFTSSSGTTNWIHLAASQSQVMGVVENLAPAVVPSSNTLTTVDHSGSAVQVGFAVAIFTPTSFAFTAAPTNLVATTQTNQIALSWDDASGGAATGYNILRSTASGGPYTQIGSTAGNSATNYTDGTVVDYTTYYYVVQAVAANTSGNSAPASAYAVGLELAPTGLAASSLNGAVGLVWHPSLGATGYKVLQATSNPGNPASYSVIATPTVTLYTNTGLANGTTYYYEVEATNIFGTGPASAYVSATPAVPNAGIFLHDGGIFSTQLVTGSSNVNMNFSVSPGANAMVAALLDNNGNDTANGSPSFLVWSNYSLGITQILTRAVSQNEQQYGYTDCDLYYLWNPAPGAGVVSGTDMFSATPTAMLLQVYSLSGVDTTNFNGGVPASAGAGANSASSLQVTTAGNTPNESWAAVISINYNGGGGNFLTNTASSGTANDFNFQVNGNQNNLGYIANLITGSSTITATASGSPTHMALAAEVIAPAAGGTPAPINVVATGGTNSIELTWSSVSGATSYTIYRSTSFGSGYTAIATNNGNGATSYTDNGLTAWTTYYYEVTATGPSGISLLSSPPASAIPAGSPGATMGLTATNGVYSVLLSWNGLGATNFNVWRATNTPTVFGVVANVNGNGYTNPGTEATLYYYEVQPINFYGTGSLSSVVSAIPYVTLFTNWISIPVDSTCTNGWVSGPGVADGLYIAGFAGVPPVPSAGYLVLDANFGPGTTNDFNGLHTNLSLNLSTYTEMQVDITAYSFDIPDQEIQAIEFSLGCNGINYQFYNAAGTAANGFNGMTNGQISLPSTASGVNAHYACPMNSLTNANTKAVTSLQIAVLDALNTSGGSNEEDVGFANIEFDGAPGYTPVYTVPANPTVSTGAPSVTLTGSVGSPVGGVPFYLNKGTPVNVTIAGGGGTQSTTVYDSTGDFSLVYTLPALANGNYAITYATPSDNVSFVAGTNNATMLTVTSVGPPPTPVIPAPKLNAAGNALLVTPGGNTSSGHTYYLLQTTNLSPPVVWTTNTSFAGTGAPVTNTVPLNSAKDIFLKYQVN